MLSKLNSFPHGGMFHGKKTNLKALLKSMTTKEKIYQLVQLGGTNYGFSLSGFIWNIYNSLYTAAKELADAKAVSPNSVTSGITASLSEGMVSVNAVLNKFAPHTSRRMYVALYKDYVTNNSTLPDIKKVQYAACGNNYNASLNANGKTENLKLIFFLWNDSTSLKPISGINQSEINK